MSVAGSNQKYEKIESKMILYTLTSISDSHFLSVYIPISGLKAKSRATSTIGKCRFGDI
jgi:hypothetical protein